jgi:hypothetical protein
LKKKIEKNRKHIIIKKKLKHETNINEKKVKKKKIVKKEWKQMKQTKGNIVKHF